MAVSICLHALIEITVALREGGDSDDDVAAVVDTVDEDFNVEAGTAEVGFVVVEDNVVVFFVLVVETLVALVFGAAAVVDE